MSNIGEFVKSFGADWVTKMSGIASVILMMASAIMGSSPPARWTWIAAILCVIYAAYNVWQTERVKYNAETATRKKLEAELQAAALKYAELEAAKKDDPAAMRVKEQFRSRVQNGWKNLTDQTEKDVVRIVSSRGHMQVFRIVNELKRLGVPAGQAVIARAHGKAAVILDKDPMGKSLIRPEADAALQEILLNDERYQQLFGA